MVFFRDIGVRRHDLTPQNSPLFLRVKSDARLAGSEHVEGISEKILIYGRTLTINHLKFVIIAKDAMIFLP